MPNSDSRERQDAQKHSSHVTPTNAMPAAKTTPLSMIKPSTKPGNLHLSTQNSSNILNPTLEDDLRVREVDSDDLPIPHLPKTSTKTNDSLAKDASCNLNCSQLPPDPSGASDNTYKFSSIQSTSLTSPRQQFNNQSTSTARLTPYEKASHALNHDDHWRKDITLGKRAGFYRLKGDIGSGNFSQVKLAIHHLTKG